jgi:hypothetical protein
LPGKDSGLIVKAADYTGAVRLGLNEIVYENNPHCGGKPGGQNPVLTI